MFDRRNRRAGTFPVYAPDEEALTAPVVVDDPVTLDRAEAAIVDLGREITSAKPLFFVARRALHARKISLGERLLDEALLVAENSPSDMLTHLMSIEAQALAGRHGDALHSAFSIAHSSQEHQEACISVAKGACVNGDLEKGERVLSNLFDDIITFNMSGGQAKLRAITEIVRCLIAWRLESSSLAHEVSDYVRANAPDSHLLFRCLTASAHIVEKSHSGIAALEKIVSERPKEMLGVRLYLIAALAKNTYELACDEFSRVQRNQDLQSAPLYRFALTKIVEGCVEKDDPIFAKHLIDSQPLALQESYQITLVDALIAQGSFDETKQFINGMDVSSTKCRMLAKLVAAMYQANPSNYSGINKELRSLYEYGISPPAKGFELKTRYLVAEMFAQMGVLSLARDLDRNLAPYQKRELSRRIIHGLGKYLIPKDEIPKNSRLVFPALPFPR